MNTQHEKLIFASIVFPSTAAETRLLLLAEGIRDFAGSLSRAEIWCFFPRQEKNLSPVFKERLRELKVELIPFDIDPELLGFFFGGQLAALALSESMARDRFEILAWLDANTLVLQEPSEFLLPGHKQLGCRPVHHTLIGSHYNEPLDPFWARVYECCHVDRENVFPMTAHVDGVRIRPYFNAGLLVNRPENGLFQTWYNLFTGVYKRPDFERFYNQDSRYRIFVHQAVLTGVILSNLPVKELQELPLNYNYPLNLYNEDITDHRPSCLEELVTGRYENFDEDLKPLKIEAGDSLRLWLNNRLSQ